MASLDSLHLLNMFYDRLPDPGPVSVSLAAVYTVSALTLVVLANIVRQFLPRKKSEPPLVFHWLPFIGNAVAYGQDPCNFMMRCRKKVPDIPSRCRALHISDLPTSSTATSSPSSSSAAK